MANPRSAAAKRLLKGAQERRQAKNKKATSSTMKNMKSVAKGTYANRSNSKAAEANVKSPVKAPKKPATTKKTNYDSMSFSKAFAAARKAAKAGGSKTFPWRGKRYGTNLKKKAPKATPRPNVTAGLKAEQKKASNKAVKKVEKNIASSTQDKPQVQSSQVSFKNKSRLLANKPGQSSSTKSKPYHAKAGPAKPVAKPKRTVKARPSKTTTGKGATASNTNPADGKAFLSKLNSSKTKTTTRKKPYHAKAKPAQPVAKPRAATKPKAKPAAKKKSSGSAIGRFERGLVRGMNRGIRKAKRAVRRALK